MYSRVSALHTEDENLIFIFWGGEIYVEIQSFHPKNNRSSLNMKVLLLVSTVLSSFKDLA